MPVQHFTRLGRLIRVQNQKTKNFSNENDTYIAVLVKGNGKVKCLMFTDAELAKAEQRAAKNVEDQPLQSLISEILD